MGIVPNVKLLLFDYIFYARNKFIGYVAFYTNYCYIDLFDYNTGGD